MKEKLEIIRYNEADENLTVLIDLHKLISKYNKLNNHLIYYDANFPVYFEKLVGDSQSNYVFIFKLNGIIEGFIHFKIFNNTIFLNNICLTKNCQGKGFGKIFLNESLNFINNTDYKHFELDVFISNLPALLWYKNLGLEVTKSTMWKQLSPVNYQKNIKLSDELMFKKDLNEFNSLFFKDQKIATIINNSTMLFHDLTFINKIPLNNYTLITNQSTEFIDTSHFEIIDLETSVRMKCPIKIYLNNLNK